MDNRSARNREIALIQITDRRDVRTPRFHPEESMLEIFQWREIWDTQFRERRTKISHARHENVSVLSGDASHKL